MGYIGEISHLLTIYILTSWDIQVTNTSPPIEIAFFDLCPLRGLTIGPAEPTEWYHPSLSSSLDRVRFRNVAIRNLDVSPFFLFGRLQGLPTKIDIHRAMGPPKPTFLEGFYGK